jgi:16S rRNA (uracil1498-N3)-methyltransferase
MNLILLARHEVDGDGNAHLTDARAEHIVRVLKATTGQAIRIGVIDGPMGRAEIQSSTSDGVTIHCTLEAAVPSRPAVDLLLALPRPKVLRRLWAQLAAIGVGHIAVTNAARVERHYFDTHVLSAACYEPLLVEGLQQARDTRLPTISIHRQFRPLVEDRLDTLFGSGLRLLAHPGAGMSARQAVQERTDVRVALAVGPEGGWNDFERTLLESHGFRPVSMGARTLRSDTSCVALLAIVHDGLLASR